jgi:colicin import membrane protein
MATMTKTAQPELELEISPVVTEQEGLRKEVFRIMEASASAIEQQIEAAVEKARGELKAENDRLRGELMESQQMLADTEEAAAIALERQISTAVERGCSDLKAQLLSQEQEHQRNAERVRSELLAENNRLQEEASRANQMLAETIESQRAALGEREKVAGDLQSALRAERQRVTEEWEAERERLAMECGELRHDRNRFREELGRLADAVARSESERVRLKEECERLNRALASTESSDIHVVEEAARVETAIQEISQAIENPETELSAIIRKNVERAQLDAYLRGLRFCSGRK